MSTDIIAAELARIRTEIANVGANPDEIRIVAVTKTFGVHEVIAAAAAGIVDIGENYAQEARQKYEELQDIRADLKLNWHFIGHLQRNKVKLLAPFVDTWQSLDSPQILQEVAKRAPGAKVFIEVNLSGKTGRSGCSWEDLNSLVDHARALQLDVRGVMGIGPAGDSEESRPLFRRLAKAAKTLDLLEVSMGMSSDFIVAVQEGATIIRIGSAFFGRRPPMHA